MQAERKNTDPSVVLNKAIVNTARYLGMKQTELSRIIGASRPSLSRLFSDGSPCIRENTKEWECAVLFLRVIRSLESLLGENPEQVREWLYHENLHLAGRPIDLIKTIPGLNDVVVYLDAMRGRG